MTNLLVAGSTLAPYKLDDATRWLESAEELYVDADAAGYELRLFVALELDRGGLSAYDHLLARLSHFPVDWRDYWTFSFDTGATALNSSERLAHICMGRNLITEYAVRVGAEWLLYLDSDLQIPGDAISKLLELDWPIVGGDVPAYCLTGPVVHAPPGSAECVDCGWCAIPCAHLAPEARRNGQAGIRRYNFPVQRHWNTAGFLLVRRELFRRLRWRYDPDAGLTDDPSYAADARVLGYDTLVRKDVIGHHPPLVPVEHRGHDLTIRR